jgi:hypothetical protein
VQIDLYTRWVATLSTVVNMLLVLEIVISVTFGYRPDNLQRRFRLIHQLSRRYDHSAFAPVGVAPWHDDHELTSRGDSGGLG